MKRPSSDDKDRYKVTGFARLGQRDASLIVQDQTWDRVGLIVNEEQCERLIDHLSAALRDHRAAECGFCGSTGLVVLMREAQVVKEPCPQCQVGSS